MNKSTTPTATLRLIQELKAFQAAPASVQATVRAIAHSDRFTFQELRFLTETGIDLDMWGSESLGEFWDRAAQQIGRGPAKHLVLNRLKSDLANLKAAPTRYDAEPLPNPKRKRLEVVHKQSDNPVFGRCPVASERTVCCNLYTIDAVENCAYGCSYCTIQSFYDNKVAVRTDLAEKLSAVTIDPDRFYHFGTGQSSDSLVWGNRGGQLDALSDFARQHPSILVELKTKSANVSYFHEHETPKNLVCSWSLNTETIVANEEHFTASLTQRLDAARQAADLGLKIAFHFHPMVYYENWRDDYCSLAETVMQRFVPEEVLFISYGTVTFIKPVVKAIRGRGEPSRILQMDMAPDPHGKLTYPDHVKLDLFRRIEAAFKPWHTQVYRYLCMEHSRFWDEVFGWHYDTNEEFERDFGTKVMSKVNSTTRPTSRAVLKRNV